MKRVYLYLFLFSFLINIFQYANDTKILKNKDKEIQRQKAKEAALAEEKAKKEAAEMEKQRKVECDELIKEATDLKDEKKFKEALKRLEKAKKMSSVLQEYKNYIDRAVDEFSSVDNNAASSIRGSFWGGNYFESYIYWYINYEAVGFCG